MKIEYPKWLYRGDEAVVVQTQVDHEYLTAGGWTESPSEKPEAKDVPEKRGPGRPRKNMLE